MLSITEYKLNPCRLSSIPYWKRAVYQVHRDILIIHRDDLIKETNFLDDTIYFRLKHDLNEIKNVKIDDDYYFKNINVNNIADLKNVMEIINKSYDDIQVTFNQVIEWTKRKVFNNNLWIFLVNNVTQERVALGIAEVDNEVGEGMLEWIQVLPDYRKQKFGQAIVNELLKRFKNKVDFVTVSGKCENITKPEILYRKCGFTGNDYWHVRFNKR